LNRFDTGTVQIKVNKKLVNAFSICSFAKQPIVFQQNLNVRCDELYNKLRTPLIELNFFLNIHGLDYHKKSKRSILGITSKIFTILKFISGQAGISIIPDFINGIGLKPSQILLKIGTELGLAGFNQLLVKPKPDKIRQQLSNIDSILAGFQKLQNVNNQDRYVMDIRNILINLV
jgi:hypothetical protein